MKFLLLLLLLGLATVWARTVSNGRIVGGELAEIEDVPYQLALESGPIIWTQMCGATIVGEYTAITAGHCASGFGPKQIRLRAGSTKVHNGTIHHAEEIIVHENYSQDPIDFDIAIIRVTEPFEFADNVQPAKIGTVDLLEGDLAVVSGWGVTLEGSIFPATNLRKVEVPIVNKEECKQDYEEFGEVTDSMFCAGLKGKDSCQGDSGGPLVVNGTLYGVVSWGLGCARDGYPGVYTSVPFMAEWLAEHDVTNEESYDIY